MSDTPRTDEEVEIARKFPATQHGLWISAEFARQLERELNDALHDLKRSMENHNADVQEPSPAQVKAGVEALRESGRLWGESSADALVVRRIIKAVCQPSTK